MIPEFNPASWGKALQNSHVELGEQKKEGEGSASSSALKGRKVKFLVSTKQPAYSVGRVIDATFQLMNQPNLSIEELRELRSGLHHFKEELAQQGTQDAEIMIRYAKKLHKADQLLNQLDQKMLSALLLNSSSLNSEDMAQILKVVQIQPLLLFEIDSNAVEILQKKSAQSDYLPILQHLLYAQLTPAQSSRMIDALFNDQLHENSVFRIMMRGSNANSNFDHISRILTKEQMNRSEIQKQVLDFAFSPKRYQAVFYQDRDFVDLEKDCERVCQNCRLTESHKASLGVRQGLLNLRRAASSTLTLTQDTYYAKAMENWEKASQYASQMAQMHQTKVHQKKGSEEKFSYTTLLSEINRRTTQGEPGVKTPGTYRYEGAYVGGGTWRSYACPSDKIVARMQEFEQWVQAEVEKCDRGEKNPIVLAAQAYHRIVTLHPFPNGNGRTARLFMDYILERYGLPPAILGKEVNDVLDASHALKPLQNHAVILGRKLIDGIQNSHTMIVSGGLNKL